MAPPSSPKTEVTPSSSSDRTTACAPVIAVGAGFAARAATDEGRTLSFVLVIAGSFIVPDMKKPLAARPRQGCTASCGNAVRHLDTRCMIRPYRDHLASDAASHIVVHGTVN